MQRELDVSQLLRSGFVEDYLHRDFIDADIVRETAKTLHGVATKAAQESGFYYIKVYDWHEGMTAAHLLGKCMHVYMRQPVTLAPLAHLADLAMSDRSAMTSRIEIPTGLLILVDDDAIDSPSRRNLIPMRAAYARTRNKHHRTVILAPSDYRNPMRSYCNAFPVPPGRVAMTDLGRLCKE